MKKIILLGSTGSIGTQTLDIIRLHRDLYQVAVLCCGRNVALLRRQMEEFSPSCVVVAEETDAASLREDYPDITVLFGAEGILEAVCMEGDLVVNALVGIQGLAPTLKAIEEGKDIALANKETLVAGGDLVMKKVKEKGVLLLPVDSEHSAIFQCLQDGGGNEPVSIILTASGGPFRGYTAEKMRSVTKEQALKHPNWSMGKKITIDSATMVNKALEIIEAHHLFAMSGDQIEVVVHPQSIVHSMVRFEDGAVLAQMGVPDMKVPIAYALSWPKRMKTNTEPLDFSKNGTLTFETPDAQAFPAIPMAYEALRRGGTLPAAFNGANEELVAAFLKDAIPFYKIGEGLIRVMEQHGERPVTCLEDVLEADRMARELAERVVKKL